MNMSRNFKHRKHPKQIAIFSPAALLRRKKTAARKGCRFAFGFLAFGY